MLRIALAHSMKGLKLTHRLYTNYLLVLQWLANFGRRMFTSCGVITYRNVVITAYDICKSMNNKPVNDNPNSNGENHKRCHSISDRSSSNAELDLQLAVQVKQSRLSYVKL